VTTPSPYGRFSPERPPHWVAYQSDETGKYEVYIQAFPEPRGKFQISTNGGQYPQWGAAGRELFYVSPDNKLMAVSLKLSTDSVEPSAPRELFRLSLNVASGVLLVVSGLASIGFGVIRGLTIELFVRGGELWERASWTTIGAGWGGLLVTRFALIGVAAAIGAKLAASPTSIPLMLAITLGTQMLVERHRARATGIPMAPSRRGRKSLRRRQS
jgi:hypothetical protein